MFPRFSLQSRPTTTSASIDEVTKYTSRIDELNLKNRTLEHSINKLKAELSAEQSRGEAAMREIRSRWELERLEWRQGCDALQAAHRVAHLKIARDAEKEKRTLLEEREINRRERVAVCQRDFRLLMFQIQESNKDARIAQLETELSGVEKSHQSQHQSVRREFQTKLETLQNRYKELRMKFDEKSEELENAVDEKAQLEETLTGLRTEHNTLMASSSSGSTQLERSKLRLETLQASHSELEGKYTDLQRANADLHRQLEKWSNLEAQDDTEMEINRKRKVELEIEVRTLQARLEDAEKVVQQKEDKVKARIERYREKIAEHEGEVKEANDLAEQREVSLVECQKQLADAESRIKDLASKLGAAGAKTQTDSVKGKKLHSRSEIADEHGNEASEDEVEVVVANPIPKQRPKPRPLHNHRRSKLPTTTDPTDDDIEFVEANPRQNRTRDVIHDSEAEPPASKSKAKSKAPKEANDGLGTLQTSQIGKGKGKSKTGTNATPANEIDDVDIADTTSPAKKRGRPKGGAKVGTRADKRSQNLDKADGDAAFREDEEPATKTRKGKGPSKAKPNEWQTSVTARDADSEEERVSAPKKKKRKINLFPTAQPTSFNWTQLSQGNAGGLNIPTDLSPVKDNDAVRPRSTSKLGSTLSWAHAGRR